MFQTHVYQPLLYSLALDLILVSYVYQQRLGRSSYYLQPWTQLSDVLDPHCSFCVW